MKYENISSTNCIASINSDQGRLLKTETDILAYKGTTHNQSLFIFIINVFYKNVMLQKKKAWKTVSPWYCRKINNLGLNKVHASVNKH
jgi:hypothetical protein